MIYIIGFLFIAIRFVTSNIPNATITAQNITTTINLAEMTAGIETYAHA